MTPKILADALGCFWNAACGAARERQSLQAIEFADVLTAGVAAVAARLEEHGEERDRRISELLEANNRYQQEALDVRAEAAKAIKALEAIVPLSSALRVNGPDPDDLQDLHDNLDTATSIADEALAEIIWARPAPEPAATEQKAPPPPPWPCGGENNANAKREGWLAFFTGRDRESCPFPPARADLQRDFRVGWDAAKAHHEQGAPE